MGSKKNKKSIQRSIKRVADLICSIIGIILLFPLFLIVAIIIKMDSKGSVFFLQDRVGLSGKIFKIWKFRTMVPGAEKIGLGFSVEKNDSRITRVGVFLRRFGIDELPQLVNIIKGEMSVVGPRATLVHQVEQYTEFEKQRLKVRPGVTNINLTKGWNTLSWKKRIEWDVWYINNWSLWMDLKILARTPFVVLSGKGQYGEAGVVEDYK